MPTPYLIRLTTAQTLVGNMISKKFLRFEIGLYIRYIKKNSYTQDYPSVILLTHPWLNRQAGQYRDAPKDTIPAIGPSGARNQSPAKTAKIPAPATYRLRNDFLETLCFYNAYAEIRQKTS